MSEQPQQSEQKQPVVWRRRVIAVAVVVLAAAIGGRVMLKKEQPTSGGGSGLATGLVAGGGEEVEHEQTLGDKLAKLLPYVTEAMAALLLGMVIGIGTRMVIKTVVLVLVLGAVGIQFAIFKGWLTPDDAAFVGHMKDYLFHIPEGKTAADVALDKAPSVGAGLLGFMMGLKKG